MDYTFEEACKATQPYIDALLGKFEQDIHSGVFSGDENGFIILKAQMAMLAKIRTTVLNTTQEEV